MKLLIACPSGGTWDADTAISYGELRADLADVPVVFCNPRSSDLVFSRCQVVDAALAHGCDWVFWFDSDSVFPRDTVRRLLAAKQSIVGASYRVKCAEYREVACVSLDPRERFDSRGKTGLWDVEGLGFGALLTATRVFEDIAASGARPFGGVWNEHGWEFEDFWFCRRAAAAGHRVFVDADLTREVEHKGSVAYRIDGVDLRR